jgi:hypothetical protein
VDDADQRVQHGRFHEPCVVIGGVNSQNLLHREGKDRKNLAKTDARIRLFAFLWAKMMMIQHNCVSLRTKSIKARSFGRRPAIS